MAFSSPQKAPKNTLWCAKATVCVTSNPVEPFKVPPALLKPPVQCC